MNNTSIKASVNEEIISNKININFKIEEMEKFLSKELIFMGIMLQGRQIIRNQIEIDEGESF